MKLKQLASAVILATSAVAVSQIATAATYDLTPVPVQDKSFLNFAQSIDNSGTMVVITEGDYNPPIDLSILDFEDETFTSRFEDPEAVEQGVFSNVDYQILYAYIINNRANNNLSTQSLATYRSYQGDTVTTSLIPGFDTISETFNDYSRSAFTQTRDSVGGDYFVGAGNTPFFRIDFSNDNGDEFTYMVNDTLTQAFVEVNGETKALLPTLTDSPINGYSEAFAINESLQVAGWGSVSLTDAYQESIDNCLDDEERGSTPLELCTYNLSQGINSGSYRRAVVWQLDAQGSVLSATQYGLVFEPEEDADATGYVSTARAINDNGIAVGQSHTGEQVIYTVPGTRGDGLYPGIVAAVFSNGETTELLPREENLNSQAYDINNDNWVVGTVLRENNGFARNQFFAYNIDSGESLYPQGFFQTAAVTPRAINNNGIVVGEGEYESDVQTGRELRAFMYDLSVGEFIDLNTLLSCEQREQYTIVNAMDINDNNEIIANARYVDTQRYITGEEVLDEAGATIDDDRIVAVKLTPNSTGSIEQCEGVEEESYERKGATTSWYGLAALTLLAIFRRRLKR